MRTIGMLVDVHQKKVWMYLKDRETCQRFLEDAEAEEFTFGGRMPTEGGHFDDIIVVHEDRTLGHPGYLGHMGFYQSSGNDDWIRVDYARYVAEEENFYSLKIR